MARAFRLMVYISCILCSGCVNHGLRGRPSYQTVTDQPNRDQKMAVAKNRKAARLFKAGKVGAAEQLLSAALIADVSYGPAHNNLGKIYFAQGKYYLAAWEFEYANRLMPERAEPLNNLGMVYEAVDRLDQAIDYYEMAYEIAPQDPQVIGNLARVRLTRDKHDPNVSPLLSELIVYDTRGNWKDWAREVLARDSTWGTSNQTPINSTPASSTDISNPSSHVLPSPTESGNLPPVVTPEQLPRTGIEATEERIPPAV